MAKPDQFDLDAVQMLWILRRMRDEGIYLDGRKIKVRPQWFLGTAASPFGAPPKYEAIRMHKKVNAGAQVVQTQPIFDYNHFVEGLEALDQRNLLDKVFILAGVIPLKSAKAAHFMAEEVAGVYIPPEIVKLDIDPRSVIYWNGEEVADRAALEAKLKAAESQAVQPEIHLRPDRAAKYEVVAGVMASAQRLGLTKIGIVGSEQFIE